MIEDAINLIIDECDNKGIIDTNKISDGSHTFGDLYDHRAKLFSLICNSHQDKSWKSKQHDDGSMFDNYFIVGVNTNLGQATYHYENKYWDLFNVKEVERAPKWDGHTPNDAIERIMSLNC